MGFSTGSGHGDFYVYLHKSLDGSIFYVGKGTGRRAWSKERHPIWKKFVAERLNNEYQVEIHQDGLSSDEAEAIEGRLIEKYAKQLVNWSKPREFDFDAIERYHKLRNANRQFVRETRPIEKIDIEEAVRRYYLALDEMRKYESITRERGLIAELGGGPDWGDLNILDRLTLCLIRAGRESEAVSQADQYFEDFPSALDLYMGKKIQKRIEKKRIAP